MEINAVPRPKNVTPRGGYLYVKPCYTLTDETMRPTAAAFSELCDRVWGLALKALDEKMPDESAFTPLAEAGDSGIRAYEAHDGARGDAGFFIRKNRALAEGEYRIEVGDACLIEASGAEGFYRAASVIVQTSERTCDNYIMVPKCSVSDRPDSSFRGFLLDAARRWHPIDYLYRYVDVCALFGINRFIIHFTDDESYTLPSSAFPKLPSEGRHYTNAELRALDEYAAARGVMIVPEIDMPGHSGQFALKYPEIFGTCGIMDASDEVFSALDSIYEEAAELFPNSKYIHAGGDEALLGRWSDSDVTAEYMKKRGIPDFVSLYGHYVGKVCDSILAMGRTPIIWEGFGKEANDLVSKNVLVISWENLYQTADELADAGFHILNASWRPLYCVSPWQKWSQEEILSFNKYEWDHWWEKSRAYGKGVRVPKSAPVEGGMLCAWGDYLKNYESSRLACQLEFATVKPRLAALAEILWNDDASPYSEFKPAYEKLCSVVERVHGENPFRGTL